MRAVQTFITGLVAARAIVPLPGTALVQGAPCGTIESPDDLKGTVTFGSPGSGHSPRNRGRRPYPARVRVMPPIPYSPKLSLNLSLKLKLGSQTLPLPLPLPCCST